jgi:hypothetical protein
LDQAQRDISRLFVSLKSSLLATKLEALDMGVALLCFAGMKDSKEFATELYDVLVRRKGGSAAGGSSSVQESISEDELHEFWLEITDNSFDTRMQIFFDM